MIKIGKHTIPTGPNEFVVPRPTIWERFIRWLIPDPWASEEREAMLQIARRTKLKTDIQELRIQARLKKNEEPAPFKIVGMWKATDICSMGSKPVTATFSLEESVDSRRVVPKIVCYNDGGKQLVGIERDGVIKYHLNCMRYQSDIRPWLEGTSPMPSYCKLPHHQT